MRQIRRDKEGGDFSHMLFSYFRYVNIVLGNSAFRNREYMSFYTSERIKDLMAWVQ